MGQNRPVMINTQNHRFYYLCNTENGDVLSIGLYRPHVETASSHLGFGHGVAYITW